MQAFKPAQRSAMNSSQPHHYKNRVLAALPQEEIARLALHLSPVTLELHKPLLDGAANYAYFLEEGIASVVVTVKDGGTVEEGAIGFEGRAGLPSLLVGGETPGNTVRQY